MKLAEAGTHSLKGSFKSFSINLSIYFTSLMLYYNNYLKAKLVLAASNISSLSKTPSPF